MTKYAVMALSGGMDSTGLLMHLIAEGYTVHALSYDYGQKHKLELERAKANIEYLADNNIQTLFFVTSVKRGHTSIHLWFALRICPLNAHSFQLASTQHFI